MRYGMNCTKGHLFQEVKSNFVGNIPFKMHDFVHDLVMSIMREECISLDVSKLTNLSIQVHHISLFDKKKIKI